MNQYKYRYFKNQFVNIKCKFSYVPACSRSMSSKRTRAPTQTHGRKRNFFLLHNSVRSEKNPITERRVTRTQFDKHTEIILQKKKKNEEEIIRLAKWGWGRKI
uniref:(northern house mosquito) hypothetical protein n=1 Tax=Culex pipiens TaxID=7175 RepID=A0A8D8B3T6_CULPI